MIQFGKHNRSAPDGNHLNDINTLTTISMKHSHQVDKLAKFLAYMLGRQPDEFALVPDTMGYVKTKTLLQALSEEPGWRHVRLGHLREVTVDRHSSPIELAEHLIRAVDRSKLFSPEIPSTIPKLLYYPIRRRSYPVVLGKGVPPKPSGDRITLTVDREFADRLGHRIDQDPIILVVHSAKALSSGATLWRYGERLYLSDWLPLGSFSGPPLPQQRPESQKTEPTVAPPTPGSFLLDWSNPPGPQKSAKKTRQRKNEWKRERKRVNRHGRFE